MGSLIWYLPLEHPLHQPQKLISAECIISVLLGPGLIRGTSRTEVSERVVASVCGATTVGGGGT